MIFNVAMNLMNVFSSKMSYNFINFNGIILFVLLLNTFTRYTYYVVKDFLEIGDIQISYVCIREFVTYIIILYLIVLC